MKRSIYSILGLALAACFVSLGCQRAFDPVQPQVGAPPTATPIPTVITSTSQGLTLVLRDCSSAVTSGTNLAVTLCEDICNSGVSVSTPITVTETLSGNNAGFTFAGWGYNGTYPYTALSPANPSVSGGTLVFPNGLASGACVTVQQVYTNGSYPSYSCQTAGVLENIVWNSGAYQIPATIILSVPCLTVSPTPSPTITNSPTVTPSPTITQTPLATATPTSSPTLTNTSTPTGTPTGTPTSTSTNTPVPDPGTPTQTFTTTGTPTQTGTPTASPTGTSVMTPFPSPIPSMTPPPGIYITANLTDMGSNPENFLMMLSVNGAYDPSASVSFGTSGSLSSLTASPHATGASYFYGSTPYSPGSYYVISAATTIGTASVTLQAPGRPSYTGSDTFTWSPEGNSDYATSSENKVGGIYYQTENTTGDIDSPFTFPATCYSDPGNTYTYSMTARNASFDITGAASQSYFMIYSEAVTNVFKP